MSDFRDLPDLAAERLGGAVLLANDEFFAPKENLIRAAAPAWKEGLYTERGKWMDGWETRRRREPGHDWCIVRLGLSGTVRGFVVDTSHFRGNYPEACSIEGAVVEGNPDPAAIASGADWFELLPRSPLEGNAENRFSAPESVADAGRVTHLRLNIFPDGGVARLRVHGRVEPDWPRLVARGGEVDLAALEHGGVAVASSDMFFGHRNNMLMPGRAVNMGDGWETRRLRGPGHDWAIVRLGRAAPIHRVELDTDHFKGNAPGACSVEACSSGDRVPGEDAGWSEILPRTDLQPHTRHAFDALADAGEATHLRLHIYPDGGVARLRAFGRPTRSP